ncbi:MAG: sugar kinase, partial [Thermoprotei archaeon]
MKNVVLTGALREDVIDKLSEILEKYGVTYVLVCELSETPLHEADSVIVIGGDRDMLHAFHAMGNIAKPVLGVNISSNDGFLTETSIDKLEEAVEKLVLGEYSVEKATRLAVYVDEEMTAVALNEIAVFPHRSATLMEYLLVVDGEEIWRDYSDGVIVATPTGSTAYSLSAGGPILLSSSKSFVIVSVNSMDITRRPLVVSENSIVEIREISSRCECSVIVDGLIRRGVGESVRVAKAPVPAMFIRLTKGSGTTRRYARKVLLARELIDVPPSAKLVLKTLEYEG